MASEVDSGSVRGLLAMATPLRPMESGITDYSEELCGYLRELAQVDLFSEAPYVANQRISRHHNVYRLSEWQKHFCRYDQIIYQIGNNDYHFEIFNTALKSPGLVVLHDYDILYAVRGQITNEEAHIKLKAFHS